MTVVYEALHYRGDVTGCPDAQPGTLLGSNEFGYPWEVIDSEYVWEPGSDDPGVTTVHLQTASRDTLRAAMRRQQEAQRLEMLEVAKRQPRHVRRQQARRQRG